MKGARFHYLLLILLIFSGKTFSQFYKLDKYTEINGLVSSGVNIMLQDKRGYLWVGTGSGLSRFNGYEFTNFTTEEGLNNNFIKTIYEDQQGLLWIGTNEGLNFIDPQNGLKPKAESVYEGAIVTSIIEFEGDIIFGSNLGLHIIAQNDSVYFIEESRIRCLLISNNRLFVGSSQGLFEFISKEKPLKEVWQADNPAETFVRTIIRDENNRFIFGTMNGLIRWNGEKIGHITQSDGLVYNRISHLQKDRKGRIWIAAENGLSLLHQNGRISNFNEEDFKESCVYTLEDLEGNIWIATFTGLVKYSEYPFSRTDLMQKGSDKGISAILVRKNKEIWYGGAEGSIWIEKNELSGMPFEKIKEHTNLKPIHRLYEDSQNRIWITTLLKGIYIWDGEELKSFNDPKGLLRFFTFDIEETKDGVFWFGGARGLIRYQNENFDYFGFEDNSQAPFVVDIHIDKKQNIWLPLNSGLGLIKDMAIHKIPFFEGKACGQMISIGENEYYLSTNNYGIYHFTYQNDSISILESVTVQSGLSNNNVTSLLMDEIGNLWAGTDYGINKIDTSGEIFIYKVNENIMQSKCYLNAIEENDTEIIVGTYDGIISIPKAIEKENTRSPLTYITGITILNEDYDRDDVKMDSLYFNLPVNLELPYNANFISFNFEGLSFSNQEDVEYQYMLSGLDEVFSNPSKDRSFTYTNLEAGQYKFLVRAKNSDNVWNEEPQSFSFVIHPPFWEEWWFRIIAMTVFIGSVVGAVNYRINTIRNEEKEKSELNQRIAEFRLTALRAQMNPHFIFNALYSIQHFITLNEKEAAINYLAKFASLIRLILENSASNEIALVEEIKMLDLYLDLERLRFDHKFDYEIIVDDEISKEDTAIPYLLIQPFIENAIIHGIRHKKGKGKIVISMLPEGDNEEFIKCIVEDNGVGREMAEKLKKPSPIKSQSLGLKVNRERLEILNPRKIQDTSVKIVDLKSEKGEGLGTRVEIIIPISYNEI